MEHSYIESLHSTILSLKAGYRREVLGTTNLSNGKENFGSTGQRGPPSKLVPNIPLDQTEMVCSIWCTNRNYQNFGLNGKRPTSSCVLSITNQYSGGRVENEDPLKITYKYLETGISTLDLQLYKISTRVYTVPPVCRKRRPPSILYLCKTTILVDFRKFVKSRFSI